MKLEMKRFLFFLWIALNSLNVIYAQNPPQPAPQGLPPPPDDLPIDSNIIVLILIALGFGLYHISQKRKKIPTQP